MQQQVLCNDRTSGWGFGLSREGLSGANVTPGGYILEDSFLYIYTFIASWEMKFKIIVINLLKGYYVNKHVS